MSKRTKDVDDLIQVPDLEFPQECLTKTEFWDKIMTANPDRMREFCDWIDGYKQKNQWSKFFFCDVKFHHIPIAMQWGIFTQYLMEREYPNVPSAYALETIKEILDEFKCTGDFKLREPIVTIKPTVTFKP